MSDDIVTLKLLGQRVVDIQKTLRELRSLIDIDRRNNRVLYDSLTFEVARQIGSIDGKVEALAERLEERFDRVEELLKKKEG